MIKGRSLPFILSLTFFVAFFVIPTIKISYDLIQLQRSVTSVSRIIQSDENDGDTLEKSFSNIGVTGNTLANDLNYPVWKIVAALSGNFQFLLRTQSSIKQASILAPYGPNFLGFDRPKTYMLVFQNPAEARGTGGIIGAYAIVAINRGGFKVERVGSNVDLKQMNTMPIDISSDFFFTYGDDPAIWQNSNMSPHFPYGARIWSALWKNQTGVELDGVLVVDPFVLKAILSVTGQLKISDGTVITSKNVVPETLSNVYERFDGRNTERKNYLVEIAQKTLEVLKSSSYSKLSLGKALLGPYEEHRILFYSSDTRPQNALEKTLLGGSLDLGENDSRLVIQNIAGNKMDYYLGRELDITVLGCGVEGKTRVKATVTNRVSALIALPNYVKGRLDIGKPQGASNSHAISVFLYGPKGSELLSSTVTGYPQEASFSGYERGRSFYSAPVELEAGESVVVEAEFKGGFAEVSTTVQPLVGQQDTRISNSCG
jgi:hypothetical protein